MSKRLIPHHHAAASTSFASIAVIAECIKTKKERVVAINFPLIIIICNHLYFNILLSINSLCIVVKSISTFCLEKMDLAIRYSKDDILTNTKIKVGICVCNFY
jgi:hypothetical protein